MRAVVVGAGFAGLAAADELRRGGAEVVVLEARDRVGGRVWSPRLENGAVVEMGAEFVLPGNDVLRETARRLGLELADKGMRYGRREFRGGDPVDPAALDTAIAELKRALTDGDHDGASARELLDGLAIGDAAREAIAARVEISAASAADTVPAAALAGVAHIDDEPSPSVAGGNQRIALELAARLGDSVELVSPVRSVAWSHSGVRVGTQAGEAEADACVLAVPASVMGAIAFEPGLPTLLAEAITRVGYGHAAKLFIPLREPTPASAVLSVPERYWTWTAMGPSGEVQPVVSAFAGSPAALDALDLGDGGARWARSIAALRPDLSLDPGAALLSTWDDDPWVRAAYSIRVPEPVTAALTRRWGPLALAGEHTAGEFHGLMEGALRSGRRSAHDLLTS
jgi:monoamine oxidase